TAADVQYWTKLMQAGLTEQHFEAALLASNEFYQLAGHTPDLWLDAVYTRLFGRAPDSSGLTHWLDDLDAGKTRYYVAARIAGSKENSTWIVSQGYGQFGITPPAGETQFNPTAASQTSASLGEPTIAWDQVYADEAWGL
ncbi:MAG TPA: DUF4214 domain-containing protein, partial [Pirellulales bacterium]|nr:DUF4214 domain-containing protein [Pirellulales bacterium]